MKADNATISSRRDSYVLPMIIIAVLFFIFGFITWVNGTLIPYLKIACELESNTQSLLVAFAFFIAYTIMALPSAFVLTKTGYKKGMALGLLIMSVGTIIFIPAAYLREFNLFLLGLFVIGTGLALLQTAVNPYVSIIGPIESAASRISIMGIANKVGGILAGLIFGYIALKDADDLVNNLKTMSLEGKEAALDELSSRVIIPYAILTGLLLILAVAVMLSSLPDLKDEGQQENIEAEDEADNKASLLNFPHLILGVVALFLYVGVEVIAGDTIINYGKSQGIELSVARYFSQITLIFMLVGYVVGIITIPKFITQAKALTICAVLGVIFSILIVTTSGFSSIAFVAALGLANSLMWPAIFPLAINKLGRYTKTGSAFLIMAISGGALIPLLYGAIADQINEQQAYWIMIPCYLFILFYAISGHKVRNIKRQ